MNRESSRQRRGINEWSGFKIMAFIFVKSRRENSLKPGKYEESLQKARAWFVKHSNVIFAGPGGGMGWDIACVSLHKSYSEFVQFKREHDTQFSDMIMESASFIADMNPQVIVKPLNLGYLADAK